jgi:hypothetical protein
MRSSRFSETDVAIRNADCCMPSRGTGSEGVPSPEDEAVGTQTPHSFEIVLAFVSVSRCINRIEATSGRSNYE